MHIRSFYKIIGLAGMLMKIGYTQPLEYFPTQSATTQSMSEIVGQVLDARTEAPIAKIQVTLFPSQKENGPPQQASTDSDGRFVLSVPFTGSFYLEFSRRGYITYRYGQSGPSRIAVENRGQSLKVTVRLTSQASISGTVTDADGEPVLNSSVVCFKYVFSLGQQMWRRAGEAITNDLGEFRVFGLEPGKYILSAAPRAAQIIALQQVHRGETRSEVDANTFYPNVAEMTNAQLINLASSTDKKGINIVLRRTQSFRVAGKIVGSPPVSDRLPFIFLARGDANSAPFVSYVNMQRKFEIRNVIPGSYYLTGILNGPDRRFVGRTPVIVSSADLEDVKLDIGGGANIEGQFVTPVDTTLREEGLKIELVSLDPSVEPVALSTTRRLHFNFSAVPPSSYQMTVAGLKENWYVKRIMVGSREIDNSTIETWDANVPLVTVALSPYGAEIIGVVENNQQPIPGAYISIAPVANMQRQQYRVLEANGEGRFVVKGLAPGKYILSAWEQLDKDSYTDPEVLKKISGNSQIVDVKERDQQNVNLKLAWSDVFELDRR